MSKPENSIDANRVVACFHVKIQRVNEIRGKLQRVKVIDYMPRKPFTRYTCIPGKGKLKEQAGFSVSEV